MSVGQELPSFLGGVLVGKTQSPRGRVEYILATDNAAFR